MNMDLRSVAGWVVIISALSVGAGVIFGYDFIGDVFTGDRVETAVGLVIGLSGLVLALDRLKGDE